MNLVDMSERWEELTRQINDTEEGRAQDRLIDERDKVNKELMINE